MSEELLLIEVGSNYSFYENNVWGDPLVLKEITQADCEWANFSKDDEPTVAISLNRLIELGNQNLVKKV